MSVFLSTTLGRMALTFCIAMVPVLELRGAIPIGTAYGLDLWTAIFVSILGNLVPVPFIIIFIKKIFAWMRRRMPRLDGLVTGLEKRAADQIGDSGEVRLLGPVYPGGHPPAGDGGLDRLPGGGHDGYAHAQGLSRHRPGRGGARGLLWRL